MIPARIPLPLSRTSASSSAAQGCWGFVHVAVVAYLVAAGGDVLHEPGVGLGDIAGDVEAGGNRILVQQVQDPGSGHAGAVLRHGHEAGETGELRVTPDPGGNAVHVERKHGGALHVAGPDTGHPFLHWCTGDQPGAAAPDSAGIVTDCGRCPNCHGVGNRIFLPDGRVTPLLQRGNTLVTNQQ